MDSRIGVVWLASIALTACATGAPPAGSRDVRFGGSDEHAGPVVSEVELQQDLQRFTGQFVDLIAQAASSAFDPDDHEQQQVALRRMLIWDSAVLDIATGPLPEVNLLDMVVFITLCRDSVERHWVPDVFGARGAQLAEVFTRSERDVWTVAAKVMTPAQQADLHALIDQWRSEHPDQVRVEGVRFTDFSVHAGQVEADRAKSVRGLFGGVRSATNAADRALLLADRAMFLAHRMPFLIRAQARLGAQEMMDDAFSRVDDVDALLSRTSELHPMVADLAILAERTESTVRETRELLAALDPLVTYATRPSTEAGAAGRTGLSRALDTSNQLLDKTNALLDRTQKLAASADRPLQLASEQADRMVRRWVGYLVILGAAWSLFFWGGYYLVKRRTAPPPAQAPTAPATTNRAFEARRGHALRVRPATSAHLHVRRRARGSMQPPNTPRPDKA